jgi:hypothetical protein
MAIRIVDDTPVVHAVVHKLAVTAPVVHKPSRSADRHKDTEARAAYRREWMRRRRAAASRLVASPTVDAHLMAGRREGRWRAP